MTKINVITQGQQLICANKVIIAAGDVNSVELTVEFDSAWMDYPARSATFYTSKDEAVQEMLLLNDKCIVPFEVLEESCVLFIGVRGVSADGKRKQTSTLAKYKISEGAPAGDKTLTPTMDLYQQYLAALKAEADPILTALKEELQASIQEVTETANQIFSSRLEGVVLWETDDINADYKKQTGHDILFDASEYKTFRVIWDSYETTVSEKGKETSIFDDMTNGITVSITDTGMIMSHYTVHDGTGAKVIGYKY